MEEFGFTPPRADKSKRLEGTLYQFTVTRGLTTEIKDAAVERIRQVCSGALFDRLFKVVTKFKLADGATQVLASRLPADTPRNLRALFSRAVETKETGPRLRIGKIEACEAAGVSFPSRPVCFCCSRRRHDLVLRQLLPHGGRGRNKRT